MFTGLAIGESATASIASVFLDLSDFTGRSFWDDPKEVAVLANSVLSGFTGVVTELGGHVLGLRGDGLFAGFGPTNDPGIAVSIAGLAAGASLDSVESEVNPWLDARNIRRVQARAGVDFGSVTFTRTGVPGASEVNVVGFSANFAAKSEKTADAWEVVVGQGFAEQMGDATLLTAHEDSPKPYQRDFQRKYYKFYRYSWRSVLSELDGTIADVGGRSLESTGW